MLTPIAIIQHPEIGPAVSGRELYKLITVSKSIKDIFTEWFRDREVKLNLVEGRDYAQSRAAQSGSTGSLLDFMITLTATKQIAKLQSKQRGLGVLAFIEAYELNPAIVTTSAKQEVMTTHPETSLGIFNSPSTDRKGYQFETSQPEPQKSRSQQLQDQVAQFSRKPRKRLSVKLRRLRRVL